MSTEAFLSYLANLTDLSEALIKAVEQVYRREIYQSHQVIKAEGEMENRIWFVTTGLIRSYYFDHTGKEHTLGFYTTNDLIFSYEGYWQEASERYLEALQHSVLIAIPYTAVEPLLEEFQEARVLKDFFIRRHVQLENFRMRMLAWPAEERYVQTRKSHPELFRKVSVRLIATYLNMTRENLSRLISKDTQ